MKVEQSRSHPNSTADVSSGRATGKSETSSSSAKKGDSKTNLDSAKTEISSRGREFAAAKAMAKSAPDVREDRVADLKKRIAEGSYAMNSDAIADRMVNDHIKMSGMS
jgi:negative regulator of flagellin synthesis FlgM